MFLLNIKWIKSYNGDYVIVIFKSCIKVNFEYYLKIKELM